MRTFLTYAIIVILGWFIGGYFAIKGYPLTTWQYWIFFVPLYLVIGWYADEIADWIIKVIRRIAR